MESSSSAASAVDSTTKLLQDLRLLGTNRIGKHMDAMEMDLASEVPDTPERLTITWAEEDGAEKVARGASYFNGRNLSLRAEGANSSNGIDNASLFRQGRLASLISSPCDAELYYTDKKFPSGISHPTRCRSARRRMAHDFHGEGQSNHISSIGVLSSPSGSTMATQYGNVDSLELSEDNLGTKGIAGIAAASAKSAHCSMDWGSESRNVLSLMNDSRTITENATSQPQRLVHDGSISSSNGKKECLSSVHEESNSSLAGRSRPEKGKGLYFSNDPTRCRSEKASTESHQLSIRQKNFGQKRLVRNGCISPINIAKTTNLASGKNERIGKVNSQEILDGLSSRQRHGLSPDYELRQADHAKEEKNLQANYQDAKSSFVPSRELLLPAKERAVNAKSTSDCCPSDNISWRSTPNHTRELTQLIAPEASISPQKRNHSFHSLDQHQEHVSEDRRYVNARHPCHGVDSLKAAASSSFPRESDVSLLPGPSEATVELNSDRKSHFPTRRPSRGKRKPSSNHSYLGECSSSGFTEQKVSHRQSSWNLSNGNSEGGQNLDNHGATLETIIDVDELPSPVSRSITDHTESCINSESDARAQQVVSDEMLARQLQEQFFNESSGFEDPDEIDASIPWSLQQEEDARRASLIRSRSQSQRRGPSIAHLYRQYPRRPSQESTVNSTNHPRIASSARMAQLRRNMRRGMDLETRINFLEALEVAFNIGNDPRGDILHAQRDFNANDYELLLALDDDNHRHVGASLQQISSLPESVIQTENVEEPCAICLETPSVGDTIRHLPCLHKFHKDCIDQWLRRRTTCPICKSGIT
ncbi:unnamed protein product [Spirodela intermedia]|uniref:RING-type domain-containing protein n=1 Tax=Spirodela intermedia TaxID=51605 RepID=A0A7I8KPF2_SPIIN|nr:unnamed protein product [Spirodela intermedia]